MNFVRQHNPSIRPDSTTKVKRWQSSLSNSTGSVTSGNSNTSGRKMQPSSDHSPILKNKRHEVDHNFHDFIIILILIIIIIIIIIIISSYSTFLIQYCIIYSLPFIAGHIAQVLPHDLLVNWPSAPSK